MGVRGKEIQGGDWKGIGKNVDSFFLKCKDFHAYGDCFPSVHPDFMEGLSFSIEIPDAFYEGL